MTGHDVQQGWGQGLRQPPTGPDVRPPVRVDGAGADGWRTGGVDAPAKLNLVLTVGPLRADGYHPVTSALQLLELADHVELSVRPAAQQSVEVDAPALADGDTLVTRAVRTWCEAAGATLEARARIDKHVPVGAGLGGGSSDAAAALRLLQALAPTLEGVSPLEDEALLDVAAGIGSDVPFFLVPTGSAVARGRGELLEALAPLPARRVLLAWPDAEQSTAAVYAAYEPRRSRMLAGASAAAAARAGQYANDLAGTALALCEPMRRLDRALRAVGASPLVAGSGSALAVVGDDRMPGGLDEQSLAAAVDSLPGARWVATATISD